jgi:hypothetical protein
MQIHTSELKIAMKKLISHLEDTNHQSIEISNDFYWDISEDERYNMEENPKDFLVGQITEDWDFIQQIIKGQNEPTSYALVWLGKILQAIGEKVVH